MNRRRYAPFVVLLGVSLLAACGSTVQVTSELTAEGQALDRGVVAGPADGIGGLDDPTFGATEADAVPAPGTVAGAGPVNSLGQPVAAAGPSSSGRGSAVTSRSGPSQQSAVPSGTPSVSRVPAKGPGWDEQFAYIGIVTQKDVNRAAAAAGAKGIDGGDQEAEALAVAAELNRRGGVLGRKVRIAFKDLSSTESAADPNTAAAEVCTYFAEDRRVIGVVNPASGIDLPSFRACLAKARIPLFSASVQAIDDEVGRKLAPHFYQSITPTWNVLAPVLVARLKGQGWFSGWDPRSGRPAPTPAKVGVLVNGDDVGARVAKTVTDALKASGQPAPVVYRYASPTDLSPAVLNFSGNGVTHVIVTDASLVIFQISANSQQYRPRYGVTTYNGPQVFLETNSPQGQNIGAAGVGWSPSVDVADANDPGPTGAGEKDCLAMLAKGGQTFRGKRLAEAVAFAYCDGIRLLVAGAKSSGGFDSTRLFQGIQATAGSFSPSFGFGNGLGDGRFFIPGFGRDLAFNTACACFRYAGTANHSFLR